jgi:hypothetical protein
MARGRSVIRQNEITRVVKGLLATGITGDIEVHLEAGIVKFHPTTGESGSTETVRVANEWDEEKPKNARAKLTVCPKRP